MGDADVFHHLSVMPDEVIEGLKPHDGGLYLDATFGGGGHSEAILNASAPEGRLIALDRDPEAIRHGEALRACFASRMTLIQTPFGEMDALLQERLTALVGESADCRRGLDGVLFDLGVSSHQLDRPERGFSFRSDGPLDMRMDAGEGAGKRPTAADLVNRLGRDELADIIYRYGDERFSRRIARAIVQARGENPLTRTGELADIVRRAVPGQGLRKGQVRKRKKGGRDGKGARGVRIDPATRTFQALRIAVNDELGELERGLMAAIRHLNPAGRVVVISFHSLEDRIVKQTFRQAERVTRRTARQMRMGEGGYAEGRLDIAPERPGDAVERLFGDAESSPMAWMSDLKGTFRVVTPKPLKADEAACRQNPRARSALLRILERL